ncbi:MAG: sce7725 family protein [Sphingobacteriia bacterium]|nr:sce7725 family protein [Sphingobacteriia bacterium]
MVYYPYIRGKQFELIALRDMCSFIENKNIISPIIEPIKEINSTIIKTIESLKSYGINFSIILNPQEGTIKSSEYTGLIDAVRVEIGEYENYQPAFIIDESISLTEINSYVEKYRLRNISLVINQIPRDENEFEKLLLSGSIGCVLLRDDDSAVRRLGRWVKGVEKVLLAERFNVKVRNADYANPDDEPFTDDHLFYSKEGYTGFSDYLTIGNIYKEGGFSPYAVAIHLTYLTDDHKIRIHHFVSDSNDDYEDVPGKFKEALAKLIQFIDEEKMQTMACNQFRQIEKEGSYPGLGSLKKLSILNHIELVYRFFAGI